MRVKLKVGADINDPFDGLIQEQPEKRDQQIEELQNDLAYERDARKEERFIFIVLFTLVFDIMLFTVMPSFGGPLAVVILELLILIPLAKRMGMEEVAKMLSRLLDRVSGKTVPGDE